MVTPPPGDLRNQRRMTALAVHQRQRPTRASPSSTCDFETKQIVVNPVFKSHHGGSRHAEHRLRDQGGPVCRAV